MLTRKALYGILTAHSMKNETKQDWITKLKAVASENYEQGHGWQVFIECYDSNDWAEFVEDCETYAEALEQMTAAARSITSYHDDVRAEIF